jgi:UDP:flavonoid glycosyltransferase YjiC (YdhE family)
VRILFAPHGTRGDIQPLIALAQALEPRGHHITFVAPQNAVRWIQARGFACESNGVDVEAQVRHREQRCACAAPAADCRGSFRACSNRLRAAGRRLLVSSGIPLSAASVAEARGIRVYALFCPARCPTGTAARRQAADAADWMNAHSGACCRCPANSRCDPR